MDQQRYSRRRIKRKTNKCTECANAIFDELWGEYKCRVHQCRIAKPEDYTDCKNFEKNTTIKN